MDGETKNEALDRLQAMRNQWQDLNALIQTQTDGEEWARLEAYLQWIEEGISKTRTYLQQQ